MKLRRLRDGDVPPDGNVVLVRGGDLDRASCPSTRALARSPGVGSWARLASFWEAGLFRPQ
jgi:hypothetical protein